MISAEALQILCSTTLIITRERERAFGMTTQGQVREGRKSGLGTMGEDRGERKWKIKGGEGYRGKLQQ